MRVRTKALTAKQLKQEQRYGYISHSWNSMDEAKSGIPATYFRQPSTEEVPYLVTMTDVVMPDFKKLLRSGELLPTNRMSKVSNQPPAVGFCQAVYSREEHGPKWSSFNYGVTSDFGVASATPKKVLSDRDVNGAKIRAVARCRSQGMDMLTSLAELQKTVAMIAGFQKTLVRAFTETAKAARKFNKRPFRSMAEFWDVFSSLWLEGRFGWRILVFDLMALQDYLKHRKEDDAFVVGRDEMVAEDSVVSFYKQGDFRVSVSHSYEDRLRVGYPGLVDLSIPGFASVANTAWDIIPFSLVLDWFFDVQATILAFSGKPVNVQEVPSSSFVTRSMSVITTVEVLPALSSIYQTQILTSIPGVSISEVKERDVMGDYALNVSFNPNLSNYRWLDLATLIKPLLNTIFR